jgi:arylsulfatase A-like enzyme
VFLSPWSLGTPNHQHIKKTFNAMTSAVDDTVGRLVAALESHPSVYNETTAIVFTGLDTRKL